MGPDSLDPLEDVHPFIGAWVLWVLVALHAAAGLYHHDRLKDHTLRRMTTGA